MAQFKQLKKTMTTLVSTPLNFSPSFVLEVDAFSHTLGQF